MQICFARPISPALPLEHLRLFLKYTAILLIQWAAWFIPAVFSAFDDSTGDEYMMGLAGIIVFATAFVLVAPIVLYSTQVLTIGWSVVVGFILYFIFGVFYFLHERSWN